ncbi:MAG: hypothetical protein SWH78_17895 [Thermodesulfobacteriota bacterium]|nr:hypothetical protein [Thermodesulfobacteriota bacterium]
MKRLGTFVFATFGIFLVTILTCQAGDNDICACYNKNHGQLRVVSDPSECTKPEIPITLYGSTEEMTSKLACVTGSIEPETGFSVVEIRNQQNIIIDDWTTVFDIVELTDEDGGPIYGLVCRDGWVNTGCSIDIEGQGDFPNSVVDISQHNNGCYSEYNDNQTMTIYTTCCKIVVVPAE